MVQTSSLPTPFTCLNTRILRSSPPIQAACYKPKCVSMYKCTYNNRSFISVWLSRRTMSQLQVCHCVIIHVFNGKWYIFMTVFHFLWVSRTAVSKYSFIRRQVMTTKLQFQLLCDWQIISKYVLLSIPCWCSSHIYVSYFTVCQSWSSIPEESEGLCFVFVTCTYLHTFTTEVYD